MILPLQPTHASAASLQRVLEHETEAVSESESEAETPSDNNSDDDDDANANDNDQSSSEEATSLALSDNSLCQLRQAHKKKNKPLARDRPQRRQSVRAHVSHLMCAQQWISAPYLAHTS